MLIACMPRYKDDQSSRTRKKKANTHMIWGMPGLINPAWSHHRSEFSGRNSHSTRPPARLDKSQLMISTYTLRSY